MAQCSHAHLPHTRKSMTPCSSVSTRSSTQLSSSQCWIATSTTSKRRQPAETPILSSSSSTITLPGNHGSAKVAPPASQAEASPISRLPSSSTTVWATTSAGLTQSLMSLPMAYLAFLLNWHSLKTFPFSLCRLPAYVAVGASSPMPHSSHRL